MSATGICTTPMSAFSLAAAWTTQAVEADSGAIGGSVTHEFMVLAEAGEDEIVYCSSCDYAANTEKAESAPPPAD